MSESARTPEERRQARLEYGQRYREAHRAELAAKQAQYRQDHPGYASSYYAENRERLQAYSRGYYAEHRDAILDDRRGHYPSRPTRWPEWDAEAHAEAHRDYDRRRDHLARVVVFAYYGQQCACCGTRQRLEIDHANGGGKAHRAALGMSGGSRFYRWLIAQGLPDGYQALCRPCNRSKSEGAACQIAHRR